jgi:hypothetical protein
MRNILRGAITFAAALLVGALLLAFNSRWSLVGKVIAGLMVALIVIGSMVKLWRVAHGDFSVTSDVFWFPKRLRAWMNLDLPEMKQPPGRQGPPKSN